MMRSIVLSATLMILVVAYLSTDEQTHLYHQYKNQETLTLTTEELLTLAPAAAHLRDLKTLTLDLTDPSKGIPRALEEFTTVQKLVLKSSTGYQTWSLPVKLDLLARLRILRIEGINIENLNQELVYCRKLRGLSVQYGGLEAFPHSVVLLKNLYYLDLSHNNIPALTSRINELKQLEELRLDHNAIRELPYNFLEHPSLRKVSMKDNKITAIGRVYHYNSNLEELYLDDNHISVVRSAIAYLHQLKHLSLANNRIKQLTKSIDRLEHLETINLKNNPLMAIPETIQHMKALQRFEFTPQPRLALPNWVLPLMQLEDLEETAKVKYEEVEAWDEQGRIMALRLTTDALERFQDSFPSALRQVKALQLLGNRLAWLPVLDSFERLERLDFIQVDSVVLASSYQQRPLNLPYLRQLDIRQHSFKQVPNVFLELDLEEVTLNEVGLTTLPDPAQYWNNLRVLNAPNNALKALPSNIDQWEQLSELDFHTNKLTCLPRSIVQLSSLKTLNVNYNPLVDYLSWSPEWSPNKSTTDWCD